MIENNDHIDMVSDRCELTYGFQGDVQILMHMDINHIYNTFLPHGFYYAAYSYIYKGKKVLCVLCL